MVLQYGAASQKKLSDFSETALSRVKTKDMGETGDLITGLIAELQGFDASAEQPKGIFGFFKKAGNNIEQLKTRYESADKNVERIRAQLEDQLFFQAGKNNVFSSFMPYDFLIALLSLQN